MHIIRKGINTCKGIDTTNIPRRKRQTIFCRDEPKTPEQEIQSTPTMNDSGAEGVLIPLRNIINLNVIESENRHEKMIEIP